MKRNIDIFPEDFCFQLTKNEEENLKFQNGTSSLNEDTTKETALKAIIDERNKCWTPERQMTFCKECDWGLFLLEKNRNNIKKEGLYDMIKSELNSIKHKSFDMSKVAEKGGEEDEKSYFI